MATFRWVVRLFRTCRARCFDSNPLTGMRLCVGFRSHLVPSLVRANPAGRPHCLVALWIGGGCGQDRSRSFRHGMHRPDTDATQPVRRGRALRCTRWGGTRRPKSWTWGPEAVILACCNRRGTDSVSCHVLEGLPAASGLADKRRPTKPTASCHSVNPRKNGSCRMVREPSDAG